MDSYIAEAIDNQPDFSEEFTMRVDELRAELTRTLGVKFDHDADMNYGAAQKLLHWVCGRDRSEYKVFVYLCSRAPVFTICWLKCIGDNEWSPITDEQVPASSRMIASSVRSKLHELGWRAIQGSVLDETVAGALTAMDGAPATVFEVLFSELH